MNSDIFLHPLHSIAFIVLIFAQEFFKLLNASFKLILLENSVFCFKILILIGMKYNLSKEQDELLQIKHVLVILI